ncbi:MAG: ubiquitin-like domain-containing protein [Anaerolineaceae bacterium]|nr:ubiquitin-like domain-containing protein [Anaerolineaceae bacterium]
MKSKTQLYILIGALIIGLAGGFLLMGRDVTLNVNGTTSVIHTRGFTVRQALSGAGYALQSGDEVNPPANTWLTDVNEIDLYQSRPVLLWVDPEGTEMVLNSAEVTARGILAQAGITAADEDLVSVNGRKVGLEDALKLGKGIALQYQPALPLQITEKGETKTLTGNAADSLGLALWQNGIKIIGADQLSVPFEQKIDSALQFSLVRAVPITIEADGKKIKTVSGAATVGEALQQNGITLQNLDYSEPDEASKLPEDGKIKVVRVREEVVVNQQSIAYDTDYTTDDALGLGESKVLSEGEYGLAVSRVRIRYEDGVEASRVVESTETLQEPVNRKVAYGSDVSYQTLDTEYGTITYYRSVTVRATSYSPCRSAADQCYYSTASGAAVQKGVIAVTRAWYNIFAGSQIYVPGYGIGTVEDIGGGIPGQYWIDLGYTDADWELWSQSVTIYFMAPAPANVPAVLP